MPRSSVTFTSNRLGNGLFSRIVNSSAVINRMNGNMINRMNGNINRMNGNINRMNGNINRNRGRIVSCSVWFVFAVFDPGWPSLPSRRCSP
jgi:hypothetical protein